MLAAWVLGSGSHDTEQHRRMRIVPSPRCATVENWFLVLFRSAYAFLASVLKLNHEFPLPKSMFSGATWVAYYTSMAVADVPRFREPMPPNIFPRDLKPCAISMRRIIEENRNILSKVVKDVFTLDINILPRM